MERLAKTVLKAQKLREESFDKKIAKKYIEKGHSANFDQFNTLTLYKAADKACELSGYDMRATQIIYLLIKHLWNDSQEWAENFINSEKLEDN